MKKTKNLGCGFYLILLTTFGLAFYSYQEFFVVKKEWRTTKEGIKFYGDNSQKDAIFSWKGEILGGCINNIGTLSVENNGIKKEINTKAFWGSINSQDWINCKSGKFLGEVSSGYPLGFGVLKKGSKTYVGNFENGLLEGSIKEYEGNTLIYRGGYSDNNYNGFGTLFKDGEFISGNWIDGNLSNGFIDEKSKSITRIWNRYFGNNENEYSKLINISKDEFSQLDKEGFQQYLALLLNNYIESKVTEVTEKRTSFFSFQPIRMFWQTLFNSRSSRSHEWLEKLDRNGLTKDDLEFFINSYVTYYNKENIHGITLNNLKLSNFKDNEIIDDTAFNTLHDMEFAGWSQNFWIEAVLTYLVTFIITSILSIFVLPLAPYLKIIDFIITGVVIIIVLLLSLILEDIKPEFIEAISSNYVNYLLNQQIFQKI